MDVRLITIYQGGAGLGERLGKRLPGRSRSAKDKYFIVVHDENIDSSLDTNLPMWGKDPLCQGVLYVRGIANGGVNDAGRREEVQKKYTSRATDGHTPRQWVHFLSYAVPAKEISQALNDRFEDFFKQIETQGRVNWDLIDSGWPQHLVAAYLLSQVLGNDAFDESEKLRRQISNCESVWSPLWKEARKE